MVYSVPLAVKRVQPCIIRVLESISYPSAITRPFHISDYLLRFGD